MRKTFGLNIITLALSIALSVAPPTVYAQAQQLAEAAQTKDQIGLDQVDLDELEEDSLEGLDDIQISDRVYQIELLVFAYKNVIVDEEWESSDSYNYPERLKQLSPSQTAEYFPVLNSNEEKDELSIAMGDLYKLVDNNNLQLKAMANDFRLRQGYRLLFHGAWFQQVDSTKEATATLIEGGNWFSPYFELSGYITLSKSRHLQFSTDLWLSHFSDSDLGNEQLPWYANSETKPPIQLASSNDARRILAGAPIDSESVDVLDREESGSPLLFEYDQQAAFTDDRYIPLHVFRLNQKRKLRSGELHYLDHPKFGAIIVARTLADVHSDSLP